MGNTESVHQPVDDKNSGSGLTKYDRQSNRDTKTVDRHLYNKRSMWPGQSDHLLNGLPAAVPVADLSCLESRKPIEICDFNKLPTLADPPTWICHRQGLIKDDSSVSGPGPPEFNGAFKRLCSYVHVPLKLPTTTVYSNVALIPNHKSAKKCMKAEQYTLQKLDSIVMSYAVTHLPNDEDFASASIAWDVKNHRKPVVRWMSRVSREMGWKRTTFFAAVAAFDAYCSYLAASAAENMVISDELERNGRDSSTPLRCDACGSTIRHAMTPENLTLGKYSEQGQTNNRGCAIRPKSSISAALGDISISELPLTSTACLFLGVASNESHKQALRTRPFRRAVPNVRSVAQIYAEQLRILATLPPSLCLTRTVEDWLFVFLARMRFGARGSVFADVYLRLLSLRSNGTRVSGSWLSSIIDWSFVALTAMFEEGTYLEFKPQELVASVLIPLLCLIAPELDDPGIMQLFVEEIVQLSNGTSMMLSNSSSPMEGCNTRGVHRQLGRNSTLIQDALKTQAETDDASTEQIQKSVALVLAAVYAQFEENSIRASTAVESDKRRNPNLAISFSASTSISSPPSRSDIYSWGSSFLDQFGDYMPQSRHASCKRDRDSCRYLPTTSARSAPSASTWEEFVKLRKVGTQSLSNCSAATYRSDHNCRAPAHRPWPCHHHSIPENADGSDQDLQSQKYSAGGQENPSNYCNVRKSANHRLQPPRVPTYGSQKECVAYLETWRRRGHGRCATSAKNYYRSWKRSLA